MRVFFDYDRIEYYDEEHSVDEERYDVIGDTSAGRIESGNVSPRNTGNTIIGNVEQFIGNVNDILYVVYAERVQTDAGGAKTEIMRLISARLATSFERGLYYGKFD